MLTGAYDDLRPAKPLGLGYRVLPTGETVVDIGGELDIATADAAVSYVRDVIGRHRGPLRVDLAGLEFCDASGLGALVRIAAYAKLTGGSFRVASLSRSLVKLMQITGLDCRFLTTPGGSHLTQ